jgi:hypothetical protein
MFYILDAYKKNLFNTDVFVWADAGVIRNDNSEKKMKWPDLKKIDALGDRVTFFCHHNFVRVGASKLERCNHALSQMRFIQGGAVFVPKEKVEEICELFKKEVLTGISDGYVGSDEKIFDFVYLTDPSKFNLIKCGWREYIDLFKLPENVLDIL